MSETGAELPQPEPQVEQPKDWEDQNLREKTGTFFRYVKDRHPKLAVAYGALVVGNVVGLVAGVDLSIMASIDGGGAAVGLLSTLVKGEYDKAFPNTVGMSRQERADYRKKVEAEHAIAPRKSVAQFNRERAAATQKVSNQEPIQETNK